MHIFHATDTHIQVYYQLTAPIPPKRFGYNLWPSQGATMFKDIHSVM